MAVLPGGAGPPLEIEDLRNMGAAAPLGRFRVALLAPMCGAAGLWGPSCISSAQTAVDELNKDGGVRGAEVELAVIDAAHEAEKPAENTVDELIEDRMIDAAVGMHISSVRRRLGGAVRGRVPYVYTPLYEGGENTAGLYAIGETPEEQLGPALAFLHKRRRPKAWALIGNDYIWPRVSNFFAKTALRGLSSEAVYEKYVPFGFADMDRLADEVSRSGAEAALISLVGDDAVAFNRAFGRQELHKRIVRLSCALEENALMASGAGGLESLFTVSSYFGNLGTDANWAFKERYWALHGDEAPALNALGQSAYEGVHFLAGLLKEHPEAWRRMSSADIARVPHKSGRRERRGADAAGRAPVYLARADGYAFDILKRL